MDFKSYKCDQTPKSRSPYWRWDARNVPVNELHCCRRAIVSMRAIRQPIHMVLLGRTTNRCSMLACQLAGLLAQASGVSLFIVCYGAAIIGAAMTPETTSTFTTGQCTRGRTGRAIERLIPIMEDRGLSRSSWLNWVQTLARSLRATVRSTIACSQLMCSSPETQRLSASFSFC